MLHSKLSSPSSGNPAGNTAGTTLDTTPASISPVVPSFVQSLVPKYETGLQAGSSINVIQILHGSHFLGYTNGLMMGGTGSGLGTAAPSQFGGLSRIVYAWNKDQSMYPTTTVRCLSGNSFGAVNEPAARGMDLKQSALVAAMNALNLDYDVLTYKNFCSGQGVPFVNNFLSQITTSQKYLSCNLANLPRAINTPVYPFDIKNLNGTLVAFIGVSDTSLNGEGFYQNLFGITPVASTGDSRITALISTAAQCKTLGAKVIVALVDAKLVLPTDGNGNYVTTGTPSGSLVTIANAVQGSVDIILGDRSAIAWDGNIGSVHVHVGARGLANYGRLRFYYNASTRGIVIVESKIIAIDSTISRDPFAASRIIPFNDSFMLDASRVITKSMNYITNTDSTMMNFNASIGENTIGDLFADALRNSTKGADGAFVSVNLNVNNWLPVLNGTTLYAPYEQQYLTRANATFNINTDYPSGPPYVITVGDVLYSTQFSGGDRFPLCLISLTPADIYNALEYAAKNGILLTCSGFKYTFDNSRPAGSVITSVMAIATNATLSRSDTTTMYKIVMPYKDAIYLSPYYYYEMSFTQKSLNTCVIEYLQTMPNYNPVLDGRIINNTPATLQVTYANMLLVPIPVGSAATQGMAIGNYLLNAKANTVDITPITKRH